MNERDVPTSVLVSRMTIEADAKVAADKIHAAESRDAVRDLLGRDNDSDTDDSDTDDEYDDYHRANDDRNTAKAKTRAQLAREKWRRGMDKVAHGQRRATRLRCDGCVRRTPRIRIGRWGRWRGWRSRVCGRLSRRT